jgi:hypothetical protein
MKKERATYKFNFRVVAKLNLVIVLGGVELLLGDLNAGLGDKVDLLLLEQVVELVDGLVEARSPDLARLIHESGAEELAVALGIGPSPNVGFVGHSRFDGPP